MRIAMILLKMFLRVPYYFFRIWWCGIQKNVDYEKGYRATRRAAIAANKAGRITVEAIGTENIPTEDGFMFFPNHQGLYDVLAILDSCPRTFAFVIKKEASKIILLKQVIAALGSLAIDREDIKQSMGIINQTAEEVKKGRNFLIFPEGTRSREGNKVGSFKGGSFKSATKAKCTIVPVALVDCFKPFDEKSIQPVTVKVIYLKPITYEEYGKLKTVEIAEMVQLRIEAEIAKHI